MDSLTHVVVGAVIGELIAGRALGKRALLWGAFLASFPDADVLAMPWLDPLQQLRWHRGFMHSLLFAALVMPLLGWLIARMHRGLVSLPRAITLAAAGLGSHLLLDACTVYGTQLLLPFSDMRVAWNLLFIIDPLMMAPFVTAAVVLLFAHRERKWRPHLAAAALAFGIVYLGGSFGAKMRVTRAFERAFAEQHLDVHRFMTAPGPLTTILWRVVAEGPSGYWIGYRSLFDGDRPVRFRFLSRGEQMVANVADRRAMRTVNWFSDGYWLARPAEGGIAQVSDIRFGESNPASLSRTPDFMFSWLVQPGGLEVARAQGYERPHLRALLGALRRRILGEPTPLWPL